MPFGKFKGSEVDTLPTSYLRWLAENCDLREPLASAVAEALDGTRDDSALASRDLPADLKPVAQEVISTGFRLLALKLHPGVPRVNVK